MASFTCASSQLPKSGSIDDERDGGSTGATEERGQEEERAGPG